MFSTVPVECVPWYDDSFKLEPLEQLTGERYGSVEHAQHYGDVGAAAEILVDLPGHAVNGLHYASVRYERLESLVVKLNPVFHKEL